MVTSQSNSKVFVILFCMIFIYPTKKKKLNYVSEIFLTIVIYIYIYIYIYILEATFDLRLYFEYLM